MASGLQRFYICELPIHVQPYWQRTEIRFNSPESLNGIIVGGLQYRPPVDWPVDCDLPLILVLIIENALI